MNSILKVLSGMAVGAVIGGLAVHCMHLQAENEVLTDILLEGDDDDCMDCCEGCCAVCLGYDAPKDGCEGCMFSDVCPDGPSADGSEDAGEAVPGGDGGCGTCDDCSCCGSESAPEGK